MARVVMIRHGEAGDLLGEYDLLSPRGWMQARVLGQYYSKIWTPDRVVRGAMRRHRETLEGFAEAFDELPDATEDAGFNEFEHLPVIAHGSAMGLTPDRSFFLKAMMLWAEGGGEGESYATFQARVEEAFARVVAHATSGSTTLVFTSGGVIAAVCRSVLNLGPEQAFRLNGVIANASVTTFRVGHGRVSLDTLNNAAAFDADDALSVWAAR